MATAHLFPDNTTFSANFMYGLTKLNYQEDNSIFVYFDKVPTKLKVYQRDFKIYPVKKIKNLRKELNNYERIVFHSLYPHYLSLIPKLKHQDISWIFWGYEYYNYFETNQYESETLNFLSKKPLIKKLAIFVRRYQIKSAIKRIDNFFFWDQSFFEFLSKKFNMTANFHEFLYCRSFFDKKEISKPREVSLENPKCYVGNSGYLSGNQPDVYSKLSQTNHVTKVYSLLAYGENRQIRQIERAAEKFIPEKHQPIKEFLPFDKYIQMMNEVDVVICFHNRMQGLGLIFNAILLEKVLVLNKKNNFQKVLNKIGVKTFSLDDIDDLSEKVDKNILIKNKNTLYNYFNKDRLLNYYKVFNNN